MKGYERVLRDLLWPAWERLRSRSTPRLLDYLRRTQWLGPDELASLQLGALRRLLRHAYGNVPWYRRVFDERAIRPRDIATRADLSMLPILGREQARASADERRTTDGARPPVISKSTSGTMGMPLVFGYDWGSEAWRNAVRMRSYEWCGYPLGARALHYWASPPSPPPPARGLKIAIERALKREVYVDSTPAGEEALDQAVEDIRRFCPDVVVAFSQAGAALARHVDRKGLRDWDDIAVICGAERLFDNDRAALRRAFGNEVYETYGSREFMLMACECPAHGGLHEMSENIIIEVVVRDGEGERPALPGETGDVVVTDLHNFGMPLIRYANGDRAVAGADDVCECGRAHRLLGPIEGRTTDALEDAEGRPVSGLVFNLVFVVIADQARQFQVVQHLDRSITIRIVPAPGLHAEHLEQLYQQAHRFLPGIPVTTELVDEIEPTEAGKRRVVMREGGGPMSPRRSPSITAAGEAI